MALTLTTDAKNNLLIALVKGALTTGVLNLYGTCELEVNGSTAGNFKSSVYNQVWRFTAGWWASASGGVKSLVDKKTAYSYGSGSFTASAFGLTCNTVLMLQGSVGIASSGADLILDSLTVTNNALSVIQAFSFKFPPSNGTVRWNEQLENALLNSLVATGYEPQMSAGGVLTLYSGTQPALASDPITTQTALATATFTTADFGTPASGAIALASTKSTTYVADGTATWARWTKGAYVMDFSVGTASADILLTTTTVASGAPPTISSMTLIA